MQQKVDSAGMVMVDREPKQTYENWTDLQTVHN